MSFCAAQLLRYFSISLSIKLHMAAISAAARVRRIRLRVLSPPPASMRCLTLTFIYETSTARHTPSRIRSMIFIMHTANLISSPFTAVVFHGIILRICRLSNPCKILEHTPLLSIFHHRGRHLTKLFSLYYKRH